ncbi:hypothetical protein BJ878DRAFT_418058 [Calycina marina]|uniref:C3H1-type domain-containing protein n=1 Tax=Calycina marina TaxID=1763456 RepID=A0A9P7Z5Y8_9HELO|nr:hypothetical protein BJ878DRAFT_418058 [Calycina marina]
MSGQYSFPPPPPPPGGPPQQSYHTPAQYGYGQSPQHQQTQQPTRGGGPPRGGRGGFQGGRGDSHNASPYPQTNGYNGIPQQSGPPQGPPVGYNPHNPSAGQYIGPQASPHQGPAQHNSGPQNYPAPQWQQNGQQQQQQHNPQQGPPQNGPPHQPPQMHQPLQPVPLSAQNYHPNYAPQAYQQTQSQFGPQQPPQTFNQQPYGQGILQNPPQQWGGMPQQVPPQFNINNNNRGRGRGGGFSSNVGRGDVPLMGPPIRMGFDNGQNHMAQAGNGFTPQPQFGNQQNPPAFSQPSYQSYPPPPSSFARPALDQNPYNSQRGRGSSNFRGKGRGDFQFSGRGGRNDHHSNGSQRSPSNGYQKPAGADGNSNKKKKKRRTNTLGLTPNGVDHEESDEEMDDVDEEARLVTLLGPDTPQLPSDLSVWLQERKNRFPTKARREAADAAALEEHRKRSERRADKVKVQQSDKVIKQEGGTDLEKQQREIERLRQKLAKEEKKMQDAMSGSKRKRETGDEGDDDRDQASAASDDDSGSDSDGEKPETMSTRSAGLVHTSQPLKAQLQRHCKYYSTGGICGKKGKCRFVHDPEVRSQALKDKEANGGKMTLAQRLILNDTAKDDLTILKSIKYLKEKGLLPEKIASAGSVDSNGTHDDGVSENDYATNMDYGDTT